MATQTHVTPVQWTPRGEAWVPGLGRRKPLIVWSGIPGEAANVRIHGFGQHVAHGEWLGSKHPDPHRVEPPCDRYAPCGGCPWMHMDAAGQARAHRDLVTQELAHAELSGIEIAAWHPCPDGLSDFRHVVKVGIGVNDQGRTRVGAWGRNTRRIVPIPKCHVAAPALNKTMASLAHHTLELDVFPFDPQTGRGVLRAAVLRASRTTGEVLVTLVAARNTRRLRDLAEAIAGGVSEICGVWLHLNDDPGNAIYQPDEEGVVHVLPLLGKAEITEVLGGVEYRVGPGDFFQTNPAMAEVLYDRVIARTAPGPDDAFVDLYCGVGGLALQAARRGAGFVVGVEEVDGAVQRARTSARANRLTAEFVAGRVGEVIPELKRRLDGVAPMVCVNPARRGLEAGVVEQIASLGPRRVAYVSCNPTALARDLVAFAAHGFTVDGGIELFDMFPNTAHVECLAVLDGPAIEGGSRRAPRRKVIRDR